jgi:two-component system C4-dicarboxylate transport response regulator DctD
MTLSSPEQTIIFVEDDDALRMATATRLELAGMTVAHFSGAEAALARIDPDFTGIVISDIRMPRMDGLQLLERIMAIDPDIPVILVTGHGDVPMAVGALRDGAFDFLAKPFATEQLVAATRRGLEKRHLLIENRRLRAAARSTGDDPDPLIGASAVMQRLRATIDQLARADIDVLVEGETGTGKELVALQLHRRGPRRGRPFIAVNCAALPQALAESELFGHAADSVAQTRLSRIGQIEASSGGSLLLDEIDSMEPAIQTTLLRVLEEREVHPIGAERPRAIDLRVIATSKVPLDEAVGAGRFRSDLFFRLNVVRLRVPPLRERREDIVQLFAAFVEEAKAQLGADDFQMTDGVVRHLQTHDWPGNVRELRHFAFQAVLGAEPESAAPQQPEASLTDRVRAFETAVIEDALRAARGNVSAALGALGLPRKTFYDKVNRLGIDPAIFRRR